MASDFPRVSAQVDLRALALAEMATSTNNEHEDEASKSVQQSSTSSNKPTTRSASITTLPTELHFKILKSLHIVHATCLGLTNRALYSALKGLYPPKISIDPYAYSYNWAEIGLLGDYLKVWMKPRLLWDGFVFVTPTRYKELEDRDYELSLRAQMEDLCTY